MQLDFAFFQTLFEPAELEFHNLADLVASERQEDDGFVHPVQEFGAEVSPQIFHYLFARAFLEGAVKSNAVKQMHGTDIGGHDDDCIAEIHRSALAVRKTAVIQQLQKGIEYIGMSLFNLVEKNDAIWFATHGFCQLAALVIAHISWRRADKA